MNHDRCRRQLLIFRRHDGSRSGGCSPTTGRLEMALADREPRGGQCSGGPFTARDKGFSPCPLAFFSTLDVQSIEVRRIDTIDGA